MTIQPFNHPTIQPIYLDYNATAPMRPEVMQAMVEVLAEPLNASSIHAGGRRARKLLEEARRQILAFINAEEMVFCGGATEANNLALVQAGDKNDPVIVSSIEHDSIYKSPYKTDEIKVLLSGIVDISHLEKLLHNNSQSRILVSVMMANNETGVIQPIKEIAELVHKYGGLIHSDAVQAFGKVELDFKALDLDMMTISSHKIGGPIGAAALVFRKNLNLKNTIYGGGQKKNLRAGTENVAAVTGFARIVQLQVEKVPRGTVALADLENKISNLGGLIIASKSSRLANTSCIIMPGIPAATQLMHFDLNNIMVSSGSACSSGKVEISRVLKNMGVEQASQVIRVSAGWATTDQELEKFIEAWARLKQQASAT